MTIDVKNAFNPIQRLDIIDAWKRKTFFPIWSKYYGTTSETDSSSRVRFRVRSSDRRCSDDVLELTYDDGVDTLAYADDLLAETRLIKYLGVTQRKKLDFSGHIDEVVSKANSGTESTNRLMPNIGGPNGELCAHRPTVSLSMRHPYGGSA